MLRRQLLQDRHGIVDLQVYFRPLLVVTNEDVLPASQHFEVRLRPDEAKASLPIAILHGLEEEAGRLALVGLDQATIGQDGRDLVAHEAGDEGQVSSRPGLSRQAEECLTIGRVHGGSVAAGKSGLPEIAAASAPAGRAKRAILAAAPSGLHLRGHAMPMRRLIALAAVLFPVLLLSADPPRGFYRQPALRDGTIVFSAEGDLWLVGVDGGEARRLTTHHGEETHPTISPDGATLAFCGQYEGPTEIYTMPLTGGPPLRRTFTGGRVVSVGWTDDGKLIYGTNQYSTLPGRQLVVFDPRTNEHELLPLAQAADGCFGDEGRLYFTRWPSQGSHTKRYQGGTAQDIWRFAPGDAEARCLTCDYHGTNRNPMFHDGRVYFETDRSGAMNIWSMQPDGSDLKQHTRHLEWEVKSPSLDAGRIVYRLGTDLRLYDIARDRDRAIEVHLAGDFDQSRERWLEKPLEYVSSWDLSPDGSQLVLTARGEIFVISTKHERRLRLTRDSLVRYRQARFLPDGEAVLALSDETGELEFWSLPLDPTAARKQLSTDGDIFRTDGTPSPDGKWLAFQDKKQILWLLDIESGSTTRLAHCPYEVFAGLTWSPDSRFLAFAQPAKNTHPQIKLYDTQTETTIDVTSDRTRSFSPTFSADGAWLYFLSDRHFRSSVSDPWGFRQPEPYFEKTVKLYGVSLTAERRSPFAAEDELTLAASDEVTSEEVTEDGEDAEPEEEAEETVEYDLIGLTERCFPVPAPPGNYSRLAAGTEALFYLDVDDGNPALLTLPIKRQEAEPKTVIGGVSSYLLSGDRQKLLLRKGKRVLHRRRRRQGRLRRGQGGPERLALQHRPSRRVAADAHRSLAPGARLLLRSRHARRRLARHAREVPAPRRPR